MVFLGGRSNYLFPATGEAKTSLSPFMAASLCSMKTSPKKKTKKQQKRKKEEVVEGRG